MTSDTMMPHCHRVNLYEDINIAFVLFLSLVCFLLSASHILQLFVCSTCVTAFSISSSKCCFSLPCVLIKYHEITHLSV